MYGMLWYQQYPQRLLQEQQAMAQLFPQFQLLRRDETLFWYGSLTTNLGNTYEVVVDYPDRFPSDAPTVKPVNPIVHSVDDTGKLKHQYPDGKLCLFWPGDRTFTPNTTAATIVAMAAAWLFAYESWLQSGKRLWPGPEYEH